MGLTFPLFQNYPQYLYGISQKSDGSMKLFDNRADEIENLKNRSRFFKKLGIDLKSVVATVPHHGTNIVTVTAHDTGKKLLDLDGLITQEPNITLTFTVAD